MAVRVCSQCDELMTQGYAVEKRDMEYYCSDNCLYKEHTLTEVREMDAAKTIVFHEWNKETCDDEDFGILMNALQNDPTPQYMADVMDILRTDVEGLQTMNRFVDYLNEQD